MGKIQKFEIFYKEETEEYIFNVPHISIYYEGVKQQETFILSETLHLLCCNKYFNPLDDDYDLAESLRKNPICKDIILFCVSIAGIDEHFIMVNTPEWIPVWKDMIKLGIIEMKVKWNCLSDIIEMVDF